MGNGRMARTRSLLVTSQQKNTVFRYFDNVYSGSAPFRTTFQQKTTILKDTQIYEDNCCDKLIK